MDMWPSVSLAGWILVPVFGIGFLVWGYFSILRVIPKSDRDGRIRTDVYSVKASYGMIWTGLFLVLLWSVAAVVIRSVAVLKALGVI